MRMQLKDKHIYWIAAANALLLILFYKPLVQTDTASYIRAWDECLAHGELDIGRTPVYPLFLGLCKMIAGESFATMAVWVQYAVFLLSVRFFQKTAAMVVESPTAVRWLTLFYAVMPGFAAWSSEILTESLAMSGCVFLFYCMAGFHKTGAMRHAIFGTLWLALLVFLRPAFVYLLAVCAVGWLFAIKRGMKSAAVGLLGVALAILLMVGYCCKFRERYGVFSVSSVSTSNQAYIAFQNRLMRAEFTDDEAYRAFILEHQDEPTDLWALPDGKIVERFGLATVNESLERSYRAFPKEWLKTIGGRVKMSAKDLFPESYTRGIVNIVAASLQMPMALLYWAMGVYLAILLRRMIRRRQFSPVSIILWLAVAGNIATAVVGAQAEWPRLIVPSTPLLLIMLGQATNSVEVKRGANEIRFKSISANCHECNHELP